MLTECKKVSLSHVDTRCPRRGIALDGDTLSDRGRATPDAMKAAMGQRTGEQSMKGQRDGRRSGMSIGRRRSRGR